MRDYSEVVDLISPTLDEILRVNRTRDSLVEAIEESFCDDPAYSHTTIIGSAATGNFLRGYRDIDGLLLFHRYNKDSFRARMRKIKGLEDIKFTGKKLMVEDKMNAKYNYFDVSLGAILLDGTPETSLGLDMEKHPLFVKIRLKESQRKDVLLTKQFFKNVGLYGKKLCGFTIEQMVSFFGGFEEILRELERGTTVYIDYSGQYKGERTPMVVSYPFCGLDNLTKKVTLEDLEKSKKYAQIVLSDPEQFLEDTRRVMNRAFWKKRASKYGDSEEFGFPDIYLSRKENRILRNKIGPYGRKKILDAGCGNGYSTIAITRPGDNYVWGIDASVEAIEIANRLKDKRRLEDIVFVVGEITNTPFDNNFFDVVYAKRTLSNLSSRKEQKKAIDEVIRVTKIGGTVYIFDIFMEGYEKLNKLRVSFGLEPLELPFHCIPLTNEFIETMSQRGFEIHEEEDPTSTYYFMSRVIYPWLLKPFKMQPKAKSLPNSIFSRLPSFGSIGVNKLYILIKR